MLYGAHVSAAGGITNAIPRAVDLGCDAIQIFTQSSRQWKPTNHDPAMLAQFGPMAAAAGIGYSICHAIYFINLASLDDEIYQKSVDALTNTVGIAAQIGADVCVHVGSHRGNGLEATMPRIQAGLDAAFEVLAPDCWLLLENSAGAGDTIGRDVGELAAVIAASGHPRLGLCIDTCHIYVSGIDLRDAADGRPLPGATSTTRSGSTACARCTSTTPPPRSARTATGTPTCSRASWARRWASSSSHPALQGLPAILETPGQEGKGSDREEVDRLKRVHRAGLAERAARRAR